MENLSSQFELLDSITKALLAESTSSADVQGIFDEVTQDFENLALRLQADADIVLNPAFEGAVVKTSDNCENELTNDELGTVSCFLLLSEQTAYSPTESSDFIQRALKRRKLKIVVVNAWICDSFYLHRT